MGKRGFRECGKRGRCDKQGAYAHCRGAISGKINEGTGWGGAMEVARRACVWRSTRQIMDCGAWEGVFYVEGVSGIEGGFVRMNGSSMGCGEGLMWGGCLGRYGQCRAGESRFTFSINRRHDVWAPNGTYLNTSIFGRGGDTRTPGPSRRVCNSARAIHTCPECTRPRAFFPIHTAFALLLPPSLPPH